MLRKVFFLGLLASHSVQALDLHVSPAVFVSTPYSTAADQPRLYFDVSGSDSVPDAEYMVSVETEQGVNSQYCQVGLDPCFVDVLLDSEWQITNVSDFDSVSTESGFVLLASDDPSSAPTSTSAPARPALPTAVTNALAEGLAEQLQQQSGEWVRLRGGQSGGILQTSQGLSLGFQPLERTPLVVSLGVDQHLGESRRRVDAMLGSSGRQGQWIVTGSSNVGWGEQSSGEDSSWLSVGGELWHTQGQSGPFVAAGLHAQATSASRINGIEISDWRSSTLEVQGGWRQSLNVPTGIGTLAVSLDLGMSMAKTENSGFFRSESDLTPLVHSPSESSALLRLSLGQTRRGQNWLLGLDYAYGNPRLAFNWSW